MVKSEEVAVVIPALNEVSTIGEVVTGCLEFGYTPFVVDDGSTDSTAETARRAGAEVLQMPYQTGAWSAIQAGLLHTVKSGRFKFYVTLDGDGQHEPMFISELLKAYESKPVNVIIGSYPQRGSVARKTAWRFFSLLTQLKVRDMTSGFRLYDAKAIDVLLTHEAALLDYQDLGVLLQLRRYNIDCEEVPVLMSDRAIGHSRVFDTWFTVARYMLKTCIWIVADWGAGPPRSHGGWRDYDAV